MSAISKQIIRRRAVGENVWLSHGAAEADSLAALTVRDITYEVLPSEDAVGRAMFAEI